MESFLETLTQLLRNQLQGTQVLAYPVAFIAGILISLTPCVYPIIPIIISYIGGSQERNRLKVFLLSLSYVIGVAITYSGLGIFAALSGKLFGELQTNPIAYIIVGNIIILFGLSMLDVFLLPIPSFLRGAKLKPGKKGFLSAFGIGLTSGFVAVPCTAAVLGVLLSYVASRQNLFFGASLLFVFALGIGVLLVAIGTFTGILVSLPKSGAWMSRIQKVFGFAMILLGEYFIFQAGRLM
jgi:thiol:disulfide interchange protein DsbD